MLTKSSNERAAKIGSKRLAKAVALLAGTPARELVAETLIPEVEMMEEEIPVMKEKKKRKLLKKVVASDSSSD
jgi:hypothetical protein